VRLSPYRHGEHAPAPRPAPCEAVVGPDRDSAPARRSQFPCARSRSMLALVYSNSTRLLAPPSKSDRPHTRRDRSIRAGSLATNSQIQPGTHSPASSEDCAALPRAVCPRAVHLIPIVQRENSCRP
jgi:hypothetical protein